MIYRFGKFEVGRWVSFQYGFIESSCWTPMPFGFIVEILSRCTLSGLKLHIIWPVIEFIWIYEFASLGILIPACFVSIDYRGIHYFFLTPRRLKVHTHKATNHMWLVKIIHFVVFQKRVYEATGKGTSIRSESQPMQVLKVEVSGDLKEVGLLCLPLMKQVKCDRKKTGGWEERLEPTFCGCWEFLLWRCGSIILRNIYVI